MARSLRKLGFTAKEYDIKTDARLDVTIPAVLSSILREIRAGRVLGVMLAPPCTTFSTIRALRGAVRSKTFPWGLAPLPAKHAKEVDEANACVKSTIEIVKACLSKQTPFFLENPKSSLFWYLPEVQKWFSRKHVIVSNCDYCQYGTPYRKPTRFLSAYLDHVDLGRVAKTCTPHGPCSRTHKPHSILIGRGPTGEAKTRSAQSYPRDLCSALAVVLVNHVRAKHYNNFQKALPTPPRQHRNELG